MPWVLFHKGKKCVLHEKRVCQCVCIVFIKSFNNIDKTRKVSHCNCLVLLNKSYSYCQYVYNKIIREFEDRLPLVLSCNTQNKMRDSLYFAKKKFHSITKTKSTKSDYLIALMIYLLWYISNLIIKEIIGQNRY